MKPLAALTITWGSIMMVFFAVRFTGTHIPGIPDLQQHWGTTVSNGEAVAILSLMIALLFLLFREQQQTSRERAILAGEMQAAQQVQRLLAPESICALDGLRLEIAFLPVGEVGGDFYSCCILPGNRQRILLGDVSGKGAAAAMTAAVLLGAAQRRDHDHPAELLDHLNRVLGDMRLGGFATCFCAEISQGGSLIIANAGHLAPYHNGREVPLESRLPLGISATTEYTEATLPLECGDRLTFLSDGVVEAQNTQGELFGFERTQAISARSAHEIASAAQAHGQQDDITVLTLTFGPAKAVQP
jgi:serine phosphatase RsbU (regulator of sigma subunit)